ncbi:MAG TPA: hypothetical protein ENK55_07325 [Actinobacteria bacterium]|nr:hypothetical protein [Actinomycetota bacterium]
MRGLAAIAAGGAVWVLVTGRLPTLPGRPLRPPPAATLGLSMVAFVVGTALALGLLAVPSAALAIGGFTATTPFLVEAARRRRAVEQVAGAWPDVLARLRARLAAGETLPDAFIAAVAAGPAPLAEAAREVADAVAFGDGFAPALERLRDRLADPTADRVLVTLAAAHRTGGPHVATIVGALAGSVADEIRLRKAHDAALTEQRMTAAVALIAPWALLTLTVATNPQAAAAYRTSAGTVVVGIGAVATGLGFVLARRATRLSRLPRVLR